MHFKIVNGVCFEIALIFVPFCDTILPKRHPPNIRWGTALPCPQPLSSLTVNGLALSFQISFNNANNALLFLHDIRGGFENVI